MGKTNYGVIQEQGFPVGKDLGFTPISENERESVEKENKEKDSEDRN